MKTLFFTLAIFTLNLVAQQEVKIDTIYTDEIMQEMTTTTMGKKEIHKIPKELGPVNAKEVVNQGSITIKNYSMREPILAFPPKTNSKKSITEWNYSEEKGFFPNKKEITEETIYWEVMVYFSLIILFSFFVGSFTIKGFNKKKTIIGFFIFGIILNLALIILAQFFVKTDVLRAYMIIFIGGGIFGGLSSLILSLGAIFNNYFGQKKKIPFSETLQWIILSFSTLLFLVLPGMIILVELIFLIKPPSYELIGGFEVSYFMFGVVFLSAMIGSYQIKNFKEEEK